ncbi:MAG: hypothetical protein IIC67_10135 [Thaumarchaeota archaeon]|nr:hypothetical protein [Nitrososphaerota archaeon]
MTQEIIEFLKTLDWFLITLFIGIIVFVGSLALVMFRIKKYKPSFLRSEKIIKSESEEDTIYNWDIIRSIFTNCLLFAGGFYMISNVVVFVVLREWYIDPIFLTAIAAIFGFHLLQTFDKFYKKMTK